MTERENLIKLIGGKVCRDYSPNCYAWGRPHSCEKCDAEGITIGELADHLLANEVIIPPCKAGDTVYFLQKMEHRITEHRVDSLYIGKKGISIRIAGLMNSAKPHDFGRIFFTSREEAKAALKSGERECLII